MKHNITQHDKMQNSALQLLHNSIQYKVTDLKHYTCTYTYSYTYVYTYIHIHIHIHVYIHIH